MLDVRVDILDESESLLRKLVRLAGPVALSMALHTSYSVVDMFWVSQLGRDAVASVTLGGMIFFLGFAVTQIFGSGAMAVFARAWGAGEQHQAGKIFRDCLGLSLATGLALAIASAIYAPEILRLLGAEPNVVTVGTPYLRIALFIFAASMPFHIVLSALRAGGNVMTPLLLTSVATVINVVLDPLMIFGLGPFPKMGVQGAAAASVLSLSVALVLSLVLMRGPRSDIRPVWRGVPDWEALRDVLTIGLPACAHYVLISATHTAMLRMVACYGTGPLAAAGIAARITGLSFLPCMGLGTATATMVGQYLGAGSVDKAERTVRAAAVACVAMTAVIGGLYAAVPGPLLQLFKQDPAMLHYGIIYMRIFAASFIFVSLTIVLTRAFQGAGDTVWPTVIAALRFVLFLVLGLLAMRHTAWGAVGVWSAMAVCHVLQAGVLGLAYRQGTWKRKRLVSVEGWQRESVDSAGAKL